MKKNGYLLAGGLLIGLLIGLMIIYGGQIFGNFFPANKVPKVGSYLSPVELQDFQGTVSHIEDYFGKPMVVNFWATWCKPCDNEMPLLKQIAAEFSEDLVVIGINVEEEQQIVQKYVLNRNIKFPIFLDPEGKAADQYLINGYPTTFFLDGQGKVVAIRVGELDEEMLSEYLARLGVAK